MGAQSEELQAQQLISEADVLLESSAAAPQPFEQREDVDQGTARGNRKQAEAKLRSALTLRPNSAAAHRSLATLQYQNRKYDDSLLEIKRVVALDRPSADSYAFAGLLYSAKQEFGAALTAYDQALAMDARNVEALNGEGAIYLLHGKYGEAQKSFERAAKLTPKTVYLSSISVSS